MAFSGGNFTRLYNWVTDAANGVKILATRMDGEMDGMATGLSTCITKDGQTTVTANLPMATFRHTGVGAASARTDYTRASQTQDSSLTYATVGGTANALTLTLAPAPTAYATGMEVGFIPASTNTATATGNLNAIGAKTFKKSIGGAKVDLVPGDLIANVPAKAIYDGTDLILATPQTYTHGADIASATTVNLDTATGDLVDVTGTTTITAVTLSEGREATVRFTGILTLTHGASLVLPGSVNITTAAGDFAMFRGYASGVVRCVHYAPLTGTAFLGRVQAFTKAQGSSRFALTDAATIAVDASLSNVFTVTLAGNRTLGQPTNPTDGQGITIFITQDATGSRTLAYHADWLFPGGVDPTLTTTAAAVDVLSAVYNGATTKWYGVLNRAFA